MIEDLREDIFDNFRLAMVNDTDLEEFEAGLRRAFAEQLTDGLLPNLEHTQEEGTLLQIRVRHKGADDAPRLVETKKVRILEVLPELRKKLESELKSKEIAGPVYYWLASNSRLPTTLRISEATRQETDRQRAEAADAVPMQTRQISANDTANPLALGGVPLEKNTEPYLKVQREHAALVAQMGWGEVLAYTLADFGMYLALCVLCGYYLWHRQRHALTDWPRYVSMLGLIVVAVSLAWLTSIDQARAESIPLTLFAMTAAIAYRHEVALLLSAAVCLIYCVSVGQGLAEFTMLLATMTAAVLLLGRIRSRTKLLYVGVLAGVAAALTSLGVGTLTGANVGSVLVGPVELPVLLVHSLWLGFCAVISGLLMTGLLPFIESLFDVQTDISLLELGDAAHPLLQELVRRAPGTYNHSINVASISEAAADSIGANGLLCRVGAYFHDIGKMLKPGYFVENQGLGGNRHESLMPAMSTLVIIAHVKDGADLARQHGLPQAIIDF
ncbi:MAG: HDIG domain-containing protein, partial [Planctomycetales bacterium]|nr:HDIG domain-containing protein [Planctomycetales bacterium]